MDLLHCDDGWIPGPDQNCYKLDYTMDSWNDLYLTTTNDYSAIVSIDSMREWVSLSAIQQLTDYY